MLPHRELVIYVENAGHIYYATNALTIREALGEMGEMGLILESLLIERVELRDRAWNILETQIIT